MTRGLAEGGRKSLAPKGTSAWSSSPLHCPVHLMVAVLTPPAVSSAKEATETRSTVCGEKETYMHHKERTISYRVLALHASGYLDSLLRVRFKGAFHIRKSEDRVIELSLGLRGQAEMSHNLVIHVWGEGEGGREGRRNMNIHTKCCMCLMQLTYAPTVLYLTHTATLRGISVN